MAAARARASAASVLCVNLVPRAARGPLAAWSSSSSPACSSWPCCPRGPERLALDEAAVPGRGRQRRRRRPGWRSLLAEAGAFSLLTAAAGAPGRWPSPSALGRARFGVPLRAASPPWPGRGSRRSCRPSPSWPWPSASRRAPASTSWAAATPGAYVAAMAMIARTGGIAYTDPLVLAVPAEDVELFFRHPERPELLLGRASWASPSSGRRPGAWSPSSSTSSPPSAPTCSRPWACEGALAAPPVFGVLGTLAALLRAPPALRRRPRPCSAALLLAMNVVQVWFARYPVSEPMSQFLIFLGLLAFARWEERGAPAFAALAGSALGLSLLVRIDSVLLVVPLGLYLLSPGPARPAAARPLAAAPGPVRPARRPRLAPRRLVRAEVPAGASRPGPTGRQPPGLGGWRRRSCWPSASGCVQRLGPCAGARWSATGRAAAARWRSRPSSCSRLYAYFLRPRFRPGPAATATRPRCALADPGWLLDPRLRPPGRPRRAGLPAPRLVRDPARPGWALGLAPRPAAEGGRASVPRPAARSPSRGSTSTRSASGTTTTSRCAGSCRWSCPSSWPSPRSPSCASAGAQRAARASLAGALAVVPPRLFARDTARIARFTRLAAARWTSCDDVARRFAPGRRRDLRAAAEHPPALPAPVGRPRRERRWSWRASTRTRAAAAPGRGLAGPLPNIYFVHTYAHRPVRHVPGAGGGPSRFGTYEWERAYDRPPRGPGVQSLTSPSRASCRRRSCRCPPCPRWTSAAPTTSRSRASSTRRAGATTAPTAGPGPAARSISRGAAGRRPRPHRVRGTSGPRCPGGAGLARGRAPGRLPRRARTSTTFRSARCPPPCPRARSVLRLDVAAAGVPGERDARDLGVMLDRRGVEPEARAKLARSGISGGEP